MISAQQELETFWNKSTDLFSEAFSDLARTRLGRGDYAEAFQALADLLYHTLVLSNLYGRKRMLMEADSLKARSKYDAIEEKTPLSKLTFQEAIDDLLRREPRLVSSSIELSRLYNTEKIFGMVHSIDEKLTARVQEALAGFVRQGKGYHDASAILREIMPWTRSYADLVYRNNLSTVYTEGRFDQAEDPDVAKVIPALRFTSMHDARTRPNHEAADGLIAAVDDPIWNRFKPPLGHQCRCGVEFVSVFELERRGLIRDGKVIRFLPSIFGSAYPDPGFKIGAPSWEAA